METEIDIDLAGQAYAFTLAALHQESAADAWDGAAFAALLAQPGVLALLAKRGGEPLGFILIRLAADEGEILHFAVRPAYRRQHLGQALLDQAMRILTARGAQRLFLEVEESNLPAQGLYLQADFKPAGKRADYYGPGRPALVLAKNLE
ncbi:MAG: ribosomal protein S18-alanine N-acetyltransferase [Alphaproteobacteria bacterium]|nr:ribosomal protein S18-alanine N-acetyltransferase [Alphaproteobacteria bacterium]